MPGIWTTSRQHTSRAPGPAAAACSPHISYDIKSSTRQYDSYTIVSYRPDYKVKVRYLSTLPYRIICSYQCVVKQETDASM